MHSFKFITAHLILATAYNFMPCKLQSFIYREIIVIKYDNTHIYIYIYIYVEIQILQKRHKIYFV